MDSYADRRHDGGCLDGRRSLAHIPRHREPRAAPRGRHAEDDALADRRTGPDGSRPIAAEDMGITLPHEHLLIDFTVMFKEPETRAGAGACPPAGAARQPRLGAAELQLEPRQPPAPRRAGGPRRAPALPGGRRPDHRRSHQPRALPRSRSRWRACPGRRAQHRHGLGLLRGGLASAGHGLRRPWTSSRARSWPSSPPASVTPACARGFIGEIGTTWPWTANERKVVRAAVLAQRETGAPLMIHPGRHERLPLEIVDFIRREGADLGRTIMCHIERTIVDPARAARAGGHRRLSRVRPLRPGDLLLSVQPGLRHAQRRRAHGARSCSSSSTAICDQLLHVPRHRLQALPHPVGRLRLSPPAGQRDAPASRARAPTTRPSGRSWWTIPGARSCSRRVAARRSGRPAALPGAERRLPCPCRG